MPSVLPGFMHGICMYFKNRISLCGIWVEKRTAAAEVSAEARSVPGLVQGVKRSGIAAAVAWI